MAATTLAIGSNGYELLDLLDSSGASPSPLTSASGTLTKGETDSRGTVLKSGNNRTLNLRSSDGRNGTISDLGVGTVGRTPLDNNTTNIFANVKEFTSVQGALNDTLNIFGNVDGARIFTDEGVIQPIGSSVVNESDNTAGDDFIRISGNLSGSEYNSTRSTIYTDDGDDTIRIGGNVSDTDFFLGNQNDLLDIRGNIDDSYISTDGSGEVDGSGGPLDDGAAGNGNDYVRIGGTATSTIIQTYGGNDTLNIGGNFSGTYINTTGIDRADAAVELGAGQDSLILSNGASTAQFNTGTGSDTVNLSGDYDNTSFYLGGDSSSSGGDYFSSDRNGSFSNSTISSANSSGDTLIFGSSNTFINSTLNNSGGADSIVFGSGLNFFNSSINTNGGGDTLVFGANSSFFNSTLDLGSNSSADQIYFSGTNSDLSGLSITGADANDTLFIGMTAYSWNGSNFVNGEDDWSAYSA
jgi:hypothetical protein